jgi:hypothetical protein
MFWAPLCPSSGAREYYTSGCCLSYLVLGFQVIGMVWSWGLCVRFAGCILFPHIIDDARSKPHHILSEYLTNAEYLISSWSCTSKCNWCSSVIAFVYGVNLGRRLFDRILRLVNKNHAPWYLLQSVLSLFINRYSDWLLPLLRHFLLIPIELSFWVSERTALTPALIISAWIW